MHPELLSILIAIPLLAATVGLMQYIDSRRCRKLLTGMLRRLYHGDLTAPQELHFLDTQPGTLYFPFTEGELRRIARCREVRRHDLSVELLHPGQAFWNNFYVHVVCDFEGVDDGYEAFTLKREGYLYIACSSRSGMWAPCISHVERRSTPFRL